MLDQIDFKSGIVIVQKDSSIQDAVNAAEPGNVIYIEPGIYKESISINKANIKLIGINSTEDNHVILENPGNEETGIRVNNDDNHVEIFNIQVRNFNTESANISNHNYPKKDLNSLLHDMTRQDLGNGIAHYTFKIQLGEGTFDVVRLNRVVRESRPYHPIETKGDIFMLHGAIQDFNDIYLTSGAENITIQTSSAVYWASKNIDVWGVDLAWTFVPPETTDFTFMKDWGIEKDIDHTLVAMSAARLIRGITSHNFGQMNLLGFSYSVMVVYGAAGRESQKQAVLRNIKGLIPVDHAIKYAPSDEEFRQNACNAAAKGKEFLDKGTYENNWGVTLSELGNRALTAPNEDSQIPCFAGMTNSQALLFVGSMKYKTGNPAAPFWHFVGGDLSDLHHTDAVRWFRFIDSLAPYQPGQLLYENYACLCDEIDLSFDDHLGDITVPIFSLGAGGGMGTLGAYSNSLTASTDVTHYVVSIPGTERKLDYGHADLFLGKHADKLAWEKLFQWLTDHTTDN